ncbi:MAG: ATP-binding protein [candidate division WOR-3 bacterium]
MHNAKIHKIKNPFIYGEVVTGENFIDRQEELEMLEKDLLNGQILFLLSPRRYGKTSLIYNLFNKLKQKGALTVLVDLYRCASLQQFLTQYLNLLLKIGETKLEKISRFVNELLPSIRPRLSIASDGTLNAEFFLSPIEKDLSKVIEEIIDFPQKIANRWKKPICIAFDEFQEIRNFNGEKIEKTIRSIIQHHRNVGYVFAGSKRHIIRDMILREDGAFYKAGKIINLGKIDQRTFTRFLKEKFEEAGFNITGEVIEAIFNITNGCPYYIQYISHELWDNYLDTKIVEKEQLQAVLDKIVAEASPIYITIWDEFTLAQRRLLQAIALSGGKNIFSQEFVLRHELTSASSVQTSANLLVERGILEREDGEFLIEDMFFKYWILKYGVPYSRKID